jgi:hypothetical protein
MDQFEQTHLVIPNRAESPVRNLLFAGQTADSSRDKTALRNDNFQTDPLLMAGMDCMHGLRNSSLWSAVILLAALMCSLPLRAVAVDPTLDELKARATSGNIGDRPHICIQIAERQAQETGKLYSASDNEKGQAALTDVVTYSELARDYAVQSHKYQKQAEIAVRGMTRKLTDILHTLPQAERAPLQDAISRLQRVRDDLLIAMFPKGAR